MPIDCVIFGGGIAGLFILDRFLQEGIKTLLLESKALGTGQTIDSQGIIHGGLKYAITASGANSASAIREMPLLWRRALAGESLPDLQKVSIRSDFCYLWRTDSMTSKLGWLAAKLALRTKPTVLEESELPPALHGIPGTVARLNEQVIEPRSLLEVMGSNLEQNILKTAEGGVEVSKADNGWLIRLLNPETGEPLDIITKKVILTAGSGNSKLRELFQLEPHKTQKRPLHMVLARGDLPILNGHCIDGSKTRITITSTEDYAGRNVWQIGGQLAEEGVHMTSNELICHTARELQEVLPAISLEGTEFMTYLTTRAEQNSKGRRPADISILKENNIFTCWPTKLAFAPRLATEITKLFEKSELKDIEIESLNTWPRPQVALPPWESDQPWTTLEMAHNE